MLGLKRHPMLPILSKHREPHSGTEQRNGLGARRPRFCSFTASHATLNDSLLFLSFSFLICKMGYHLPCLSQRVTGECANTPYVKVL